MVNQNKIKQFMNDPEMQNSVKEVISLKFKQPNQKRSVELLATQMMAIQMLDEAWKDLEREKNKAEVGTRNRGQVGL